MQQRRIWIVIFICLVLFFPVGFYIGSTFGPGIFTKTYDNGINKKTATTPTQSFVQSEGSGEQEPNEFIEADAAATNVSEEVIPDSQKDNSVTGKSPELLPSENLGLQTPYLIIIGVLTLTIVSVLIYFLVWKPIAKRKLLNQAYKCLSRSSDNPDDLVEAERYLENALTSGLSKKDVSKTRFALAYVMARMERYNEAVPHLQELLKENNPRSEAVYLAFWVYNSLKNYDEAEGIYDKYKTILEDVLDTKIIASLVFFDQARRYLQQGRVQRVLDYFDQVRKIGISEIVEQIPSGLEEILLIEGVKALHNNEIDDASLSFTAYIEEAKEKGYSPIHGHIGILLCEWMDGNQSDLESKLEELIKQETKLLNGLDTESDETDTKQLKEPELLLRNMQLWYALIKLHLWLNLSPKSGLPEKEFEILLKRLECVSEIDPKMSDPYLIEGLLRYNFFNVDDKTRNEALGLLEKAKNFDLNLPNVLAILEREKKIDEYYKNSINSYLALLKSYLQNPDIPEEKRIEISTRLKPFSRFTEIEGIDIHSTELEQEPSVMDIQNRGVLMHRRIDKLIRPRLSDTDLSRADQINDALEILDSKAKDLEKTATEMEEAEGDLMATTGEFLLSEEEKESDQ
jgi:tetratricopeptide (TPR) repeat protein